MKPRHQILFHQLDSYRSEVLLVLETITEDTANIIPSGFHNNIRWKLGHIYLDQFLWIEALTNEKSKELEPLQSWFGYGTSPPIFNEKTPSFEKLMK